MPTFDFGYAYHPRSVAIIETDKLFRNIQEYGFPFQFTCNGDLRVYYNGYFLKQIVTYSNRYSRQLHGLQTYYNIDIMDCLKLSRDFKDITEKGIQSIIDQLLPLCIEYNSKGELNKESIIFDIRV